jgi:probable phosphoglycerate mutase
VSQAVPQPVIAPGDLATELLLVRHGRSADVVPGSAGSDDAPLSTEGREQAQALARRLAPKELAAVYSSDLRRASDTATELAAPHGLQVIAVPGLREVSLGDWERGDYRRRAAVRDPAWLAHARAGRWDMVPGSEGDGPFRARVYRAVEDCVAAHETGAVAVVCHFGVVNAYLAALWGSERSFMVAVENTGVTVVRAGGTHRLVTTVNDCGHLYDPLLHDPALGRSGMVGGSRPSSGAT